MRGTAASLVRPTTGPRHRALNFTQNSPSLLTDEPSHERHLPKTAFPPRSSNAPAAPQRSVSYGDGFCTGDAWRQRHKAPQSLETEENVYGQNRHHHRCHSLHRDVIWFIFWFYTTTANGTWIHTHTEGRVHAAHKGNLFQKTLLRSWLKLHTNWSQTIILFSFFFHLSALRIHLSTKVLQHFKAFAIHVPLSVQEVAGSLYRAWHIRDIWIADPWNLNLKKWYPKPTQWSLQKLSSREEKKVVGDYLGRTEKCSKYLREKYQKSLFLYQHSLKQQHCLTLLILNDLSEWIPKLFSRFSAQQEKEKKCLGFWAKIWKEGAMYNTV